MRQWVDLFRRTPLHPQWLLGGGKLVDGQIGAITTGRVLDIGCADRWVQRRLPSGCEYIGLDHPDTGLAWYAARPDLCADAARLPLSDASVDVVVIFDVLEHLAQPREALLEIARVLRPQGLLLLSMPFLYPVHDAPQDFQRYTEHGLRREIEAAGLRIERMEASLDSAPSAGLLVNLAMGGMALEAARRRSPALLLVPLLVLAVPLVNVLSWVAGRLLPSWPAFTAGYMLSARKP